MKKIADPTCGEPGCSNPLRARGVCIIHYNRMRRRGLLLTPTMEERFWAKVDKSSGPDACWPWTDHRDRSGYGRFHETGKRQQDMAHRSAWRIAHGPIPDGLQVLHRCDNPPCVNPAHLFLGDCADNARDKVAKGRVGATPYRPRLTPETVREIRRRRALGETIPVIAQATSQREMTVWNIVWGNTYKKVV